MNEEVAQIAPGTIVPVRDNSTGEMFGRFRILRTIAFGGMAQILLALEVRTDRLVVIKRILPHFATNPEFVQFFIHEGRLGQRLVHPNLVATLEAGQVGDVPYIALEYLRGQPAIELLRAAARARVEVPLGAAVRIVADAARGLHHAHTACDAEGRPLNVVHRDVTPHNLFLCLDGHTKVLDFGIAKAASQLHTTRTGTIKGKFAYLAPEQVKGQTIDRRVDVFALGIVLHELLTLRPLFRGSNDGETIQRITTLEVPAPEKVRPGVPPGLGAVALRALQRDPERRLPSALAMADSIEAVAHAEGIDASPGVVARLLAELCPPADEVACAPNEEINIGSAAAIELVSEGTSRTMAHAIVAVADPVTATRERARYLAGRAAVVVGVAVVVALATLTAPHWFGPLWSWARGGGGATQSRDEMPQVAHPAPPPDTRPEGQPRVVNAAPAATPQAAPIAAPAPATLAPIAPVEATLRIQTDGPATYVVDGKTQRPLSDGALHLQPGRHRVVVSAWTLAAPHTLEVELAAKESALRAVRSARGQLKLAVNPYAEVFIDGKSVGVTPLQPADLLEGSHNVILKNSELGVTVKRRVVVQPNKETLLKADLFSEKQ